MELLDDPQKLYEKPRPRPGKSSTKAIFTKLFIDDLGNGPTVTGDELNEPFATAIYARRAGAELERDDVRRAALEATGWQKTTATPQKARIRALVLTLASPLIFPASRSHRARVAPCIWS